MSTLEELTIQTSSLISCSMVNYCIESAPSRIPWLSLLGGEISPPHLILLPLMQTPADDGEPTKFHPLHSFALEDLYPLDTFVPEDSMATQPKQFYPLDTFDSEDFLAIQKDPIALALAIAVPSPISGLSEHSKLAQHFSFYKLSVCSSQPPVNLPCTIYCEFPCSSMIMSCCNDDNRESKDYADGICSDPADLACEVCMPTHVDPVISALAMVANFDEQDLNNEESLTDQEPTFWPSQEHLWQSPIIHKLLTSTSLDDKCLNDLKMFEEEITFSTYADDDYLEFSYK